MNLVDTLKKTENGEVIENQILSLSWDLPIIARTVSQDITGSRGKQVRRSLQRNVRKSIV